MRYAATSRGEGAGNTREAIHAKENFDAGNLWGSRNFRAVGYLPRVWVADFHERANHIVYAVYSYATPIAWFDSERMEWVYPDVSYSASTQRHQSMVRDAIGGRLLQTKRGTVWVLSARSQTLASERRAVELFRN